MIIKELKWETNKESMVRRVKYTLDQWRESGSLLTTYRVKFYGITLWGIFIGVMVKCK